MKKYTVIYILVGLGLLASIAIPQLVKPSLVLSLELMGVCLHLGTVALFLSSLGNFKTLLRVAYTFLAIGYLLAGLGALQLPVIAMVGGLSSKWVDSGLVGIPFLGSLIFLYTGAVLAARLFSIRHFTTMPYIVFPLGIGLGVT
ncbi:MAG TPA: hypothetical protein VFM05_15610, partial [Candidatus Saccharimonadales bacterium]|nr:hypothetical protein [Candidatus Saccharimonadales bacterium]